jgi:hypothetical protein
MSTLRTALEGHDETLAWRDFQGSVPGNRAPGEDASTEARFDLIYDYDYDDEHASRGYRVNHVFVRVTLDRDRMWSVAKSQTADLLRHEQGHYDIVALCARDLYNELTGWNSDSRPKRFRRETDLKRAVDALPRASRRLAAYIGGAGQTVGVYDTQTTHGSDAKAQEKWDKALAAARASGTKLTSALGGLGIGTPP